MNRRSDTQGREQKSRRRKGEGRRLSCMRASEENAATYKYVMTVFPKVGLQTPLNMKFDVFR